MFRRGNMRVISGTAKAMPLNSIEGLATRPTLDRVKEALFSSIQFQIPESVVLDLFAGSGALGIEALSRGARQAVFCDSSHKAIQMVKQNLERTKLTENAIVMQKDYLECLESLTTKFDFIFLDPPYQTEFARKAIEKILLLDLLQEDGMIIVETDQKENILENLEINIKTIKNYGRVKLIYLTRKG